MNETETDDGGVDNGWPDEPPAGAPWDLPLADCPFAFIDCEMTGLDPERDRLVEIAVLRVKNNFLEDRLASLVRSDVTSHPDALAVHGITESQAAEGPRFEALCPALEEILHGAVPVLHGATMDSVFLDKAFASAGSLHRLGPCIDTLPLARRAMRAKRYSLSALCDSLGIPAVRWHRATEDVLALRALSSALIDRLRPTTARDLWQVRAGQRGRVRVRDTVAQCFASHAGKSTALSIVYRSAGRDAVTLHARVERWSAPHAWLVSVSRGARTLRVIRADRVLHVTTT